MTLQSEIMTELILAENHDTEAHTYSLCLCGTGTGVGTGSDLAPEKPWAC